MSVYTIVKCEMCEEHFRFNMFEKPHQRNTPSTWLTLFQGKLDGTSEGWHFCSKICLQRWIIDLVQQESGVV